MNATMTNNFVAALNSAQKDLTRSLSVVLALGLFGNFNSLIVFRQKKLRTNAMAMLFSAASVFNVVVLVYGIGTSLYAVDHISPDTYSIVYCKIRLYLRHIFLMIVRSYIILGCIASFALSSTNNSIRRLCREKHIKWMIIIVPLIWPLIAFHMPIWSTIQSNRCVNIDPYVIPFAIYFFLVVGVLPVLIMVIFISLTIRNLDTLHRRVQNSLAAPARIRSRDRQFIRMLTSLVVMYVCTNLFFPGNALYLAITTWTPKSAERVAIESLIFNITSNYILYINNVSPFYLFYISSSSFRKSIREIFYERFRSIFCKRNQVHPFHIATSSVWFHTTVFLEILVTILNKHQLIVQDETSSFYEKFVVLRKENPKSTFTPNIGLVSFWLLNWIKSKTKIPCSLNDLNVILPRRSPFSKQLGLHDWFWYSAVIIRLGMTSMKLICASHW